MSQFKTRSKVKEATLSYTLLAQCLPSVIKSSHTRPTGSPWRNQRAASTVPTGHWDVVSLGHSFMRLDEFCLGNWVGFFAKSGDCGHRITAHVSPGTPTPGSSLSLCDARSVTPLGLASHVCKRSAHILSRSSAQFVFYYVIHTGDVHEVNSGFG